jgi:hypothetical protein
VRFHWQNVNDPDREGRRRKWFHARAWLWGWCLEVVAPDTFRICLAFKMPERRLASVFACLGVGLYLSRRDDHHSDGIRRFSLYWFEGTLCFTPWAREMEWRATDPWWVKGATFNPTDFLLGKRNHEHIIHSEYEPVLVPMPEGCYVAQMRREERRWTRPRWPWWPSKIVQKYIEISIDGGIPFEGKGENSYDCGEDGLWGCSSESWSLERAAAHVVESVLKDRKRYGGRWIHRERGPVMAPTRQAAR